MLCCRRKQVRSTEDSKDWCFLALMLSDTARLNNGKCEMFYEISVQGRNGSKARAVLSAQKIPYQIVYYDSCFSIRAIYIDLLEIFHLSYIMQTAVSNIVCFTIYALLEKLCCDQHPSLADVKSSATGIDPSWTHELTLQYKSGRDDPLLVNCCVLSPSPLTLSSFSPWHR